MTASDRARPRSWFDIGAGAVAALRPDLPSGYVCPLCTLVIPESDIDLLTLEHVPPRSMGGKEMVLTCRPCNVIAGAEVDTHAKYRENHLDFAHGTMSDEMAATLTVGGVSANVRIISTPEGIAVFGLPDQNDPELQARWEAALAEKLATARVTISLKGARFEPGPANVSMLRAAYLASHSLFGYSYSMHPRFDAVREQIRRPGDRVLGVTAVIDGAADPSTRLMMVVMDPIDLQSVVVTMGRHSVFLPSLWSDVDIYARLARGAAEEPRFLADLVGKRGPWPQRPMHVLDLDAADDASETES